MKLPLQLQRTAAIPAGSVGADGTRAIEPVVLVHGTFANVHKEGVVDWWQPGSDYCKQLDALLKDTGSKARCWSHLTQRATRPGGSAPFAWTGANTERARLEAGRALAQEIGALEADPYVARYHLVAHSHGGNVIVNALHELSRLPAKLGAVVYMGTPYLSFHHVVLPDMRWLSIPLYLAALAGCVWGFSHASDQEQIMWGTGAFALVLAVAAEVFLTRGRPRRRPLALYGSGVARAFAFTGDEAIKGLILAQDTARHPLDFVRQFVAPSKPKARAVVCTAPPQRGLSEMLGASGVSTLLDMLQKPAEPAGYMGGLSSFQGTAPDSPGGRVPPQWLSAWQFVEAGLAGFPLRAHVIAFLWTCLWVPRLAVAAVWGLCLLVLWLAGMIVRGVGLLVAIGLAAIALPRLVRKGVFGADEGRFVRVSDLPPGVPEHEPLSDEVKAAAAAVGARLGGLAGQSLLGAMAGADAFSIKSYVETALTDADLTHSYYYKAPEIIAATAQLIANPPRAPTPWLDLAAMSAADRARIAAALRSIKRG